MDAKHGCLRHGCQERSAARAAALRSAGRLESVLASRQLFQAVEANAAGSAGRLIQCAGKPATSR